jgi:hypothetical protein
LPILRVHEFHPLLGSPADPLVSETPTQGKFLNIPLVDLREGLDMCQKVLHESSRVVSGPISPDEQTGFGVRHLATKR